MAARYRLLAFYCWALALGAFGWLAATFDSSSALPAPWIAAACIATNLLVFRLGLSAPRIGLISMERVPQLGMLLVLPAPTAAALAAAASFLWPLLSRRYSQGSRTVAWLRALHNAGMTALMMMSAALVYRSLGGAMPLHALRAADLVPLLALVLVMQAINISLMSLFFRLDGREVRQIVTPSYALSDLVFVPAGILAGLLYNSGAPGSLALYGVAMIVMALSLHALRPEGERAERIPLLQFFETRRGLHGARSVEALGQRVLEEARALFRFDRFCLALWDESQRTASVRVHEQAQGAPARTDETQLQTALMLRLANQRQALLLGDWQAAPALPTELAELAAGRRGALIAAPLREGGSLSGVLCVQSEQSHAYSEGDLHLLSGLAAEVSAALLDARAFEDADEYRQRLEQRVAQRTDALEQADREKERLIAALRERSRTLERESQEDPLTGLANRRCFMQHLAAELALARATGNPLSLAIADLDHFKAVNDRLGHRIGDDALQIGAGLMRRLCRQTDLLARIGGEEFALLMPDTDVNAAVHLCEAARQAVESHAWQTVHPELRMTVSIGLWQWDGQQSAMELQQSADAQLYQAKRGGRNRVA